MDSYWQAAADQVKSYSKQRRICGPQEMSGSVTGSFVGYGSVSGDFGAGDVLILHKGMAKEIDRSYLALALMLGRPSFANEVFIILVGEQVGAPAMSPDQKKHLRGFGDAFQGTQSTGDAAGSRQTGCYLGNGTVLGTLYDNQKIFLDGDDISLTPHLVIDGFWEQWITKAFLSRISAGMHVLDIGANCGYYTLLAARAVGAKGSVTAIDANPRMCELVQKSTSVNGHLSYSKVINAAVMEVPGDIKFAIPKKFKGSATYLRDDVDFSQYGETYDIIEVPGAPLGDLTGDRKFDVVKIDAEGAEPLIYKGARDILLAMPQVEIFMEFAPDFFREQMSGAEFLDMLEADGFRISIVTHQGEIQSATRDQLLSGEYVDIFMKLET
ncbi:methyltransferase, FkbM family [Cribrihabitans marinus]|uniref:Methyltransferase, FkbM family n=1 Tax=Cribrihabitans marinus TaxID=1227549 RepID=A0A1H6XIW5_9RHOB|nr:FkbM family methyltransferase [Cribrihabitans marinus]GGH27484.1 hypothetical protein GCM10010973_15810 [Cribrihabitans marinus]SEJ29023.1 methyltransferase, FkbM family [Cribrihabitans marinus]